MPIAEDPEPRPSEQPADDPFANLVLDEDFVKGATVKEASGRARILTAKWQREPPVESEPWRTPATVTDIRSVRGMRGWARKLRKKSVQRVLVFTLLAAMLVGAGLSLSRSHLGSRTAATPVVTQAPETANPTAAPPSTDPQSPTVDHPWAGSPAEAWPAGPDAIVLPDAQAIGAFDKDEVAAQLKLVKDYLIAANLDPAVISGGTPSTALGLLSDEGRAKVEAELQHPSQDHSPVWWFSRFDPQTAIFVGPAVKVQGHMTVASDGENGVLVHTDYTFVYALRPGPKVYHSPAPSASTGGGAQTVSWVADTPRGSTEVARTIVRKVADYRFYDASKYRFQPGRIYIAHSNLDSGDTGCDQSDGYFHPAFESQSYDGPTPSPGASQNDPYDRSKPLTDQPSDGKCGTSSRT